MKKLNDTRKASVKSTVSKPNAVKRLTVRKISVQKLGGKTESYIVSGGLHYHTNKVVPSKKEADGIAIARKKLIKKRIEAGYKIQYISNKVQEAFTKAAKKQTPTKTKTQAKPKRKASPKQAAALKKGREAMAAKRKKAK